MPSEAVSPGESAAPSGPGLSGATESAAGSRRDTRLSWRARSVAPWAALGLVVLGGAGGYALAHEPAPQPREPSAFCGLVSCAVLRSDASAAKVPAPHPQAAPAVSPQDAERAAAAVTTPGSGPARTPVPPRPAARAHRPAQARGPAPAPTQLPPGQPDGTRTWPGWSWPSPSGPTSPWWQQPSHSGWPLAGRHHQPQTWW